MTRRFLWATLGFGLLHYLSLQLLAALIFVLAHLPPRVVSLDSAIVALTWVGQVLVAPRSILRLAWFSESTPGWVNLFLTLANSLTWGAALAAIDRWRRRS